jgi:hypothetical protein
MTSIDRLARGQRTAKLIGPLLAIAAAGTLVVACGNRSAGDLIRPTVPKTERPAEPGLPPDYARPDLPVRPDVPVTRGHGHVYRS